MARCLVGDRNPIGSAAAALPRNSGKNVCSWGLCRPLHTAAQLIQTVVRTAMSVGSGNIGQMNFGRWSHSLSAFPYSLHPPFISLSLHLSSKPSPSTLSLSLLLPFFSSLPLSLSYQSGPQWCPPRGSGCRTTCGPRSCGSGSACPSCRSRWWRWSRESLRPPGSSPDSSSWPFAWQWESDTPGRMAGGEGGDRVEGGEGGRKEDEGGRTRRGEARLDDC